MIAPLTEGESYQSFIERHSGQLEEARKDFDPTDPMDPEVLKFGYCAVMGVDPRLFIVYPGADLSAAKAACDACVVTEECRERAVSRPPEKMQDMMWAGSMPVAIRRIRRSRARAAKHAS